MSEENKITFIDEDGDRQDFFVVEETKIGGINYILVTESDDETEEAEAYIMKDVSQEGDAEAVYEFVEDDSELSNIADIFAELLEDTDLI